MRTRKLFTYLLYLPRRNSRPYNLSCLCWFLLSHLSPTPIYRSCIKPCVKTLLLFSFIFVFYVCFIYNLYISWLILVFSQRSCWPEKSLEEQNCELLTLKPWVHWELLFSFSSQTPVYRHEKMECLLWRIVYDFHSARLVGNTICLFTFNVLLLFVLFNKRWSAYLCVCMQMTVSSCIYSILSLAWASLKVTTSNMPCTQDLYLCIILFYSFRGTKCCL